MELEAYKKHLEARHLAAETVRGQMRTLKYFHVWLGKRDFRDVSFSEIIAYKKYLSKTKNLQGRINSIGYQHTQLRSVKAYYAYLLKHGKALIDPCVNLPVLRSPKTLPKGVLSARQVMKLLRVADTSSPFGFRDRSIMEVLYSCGLRGKELCQLTVYDVDFDKHTLRIVQGKGRKDRVVPIGKAALEYLREYIAKVRPMFLARSTSKGGVAALFLTRAGTPLRVDTLWKIIRSYREAARLPQSVTTHSLRHTCATEMLKGGASVRHVQEMLGHADISTTQIYTHLAKSDLKAVHAKTAPSERRKEKAAAKFELGNWRPRKRKK
ncbi:MAG: tyrosine-type recombinase/integrase [Verrucomicrobiales bacterium]|nr:tyrosine-type recombinase/integrase [Verrucomicrobiales bacterium]